MVNPVDACFEEAPRNHERTMIDELCLICDDMRVAIHEYQVLLEDDEVFH